jgi:hypothetical protein
MELAVGARFAPLASMAAVELSMRGPSEMKPEFSDSKKRLFGVYKSGWED